MMRILHVANFSWFNQKRKRANNVACYYAIDRKISNGLIRNGHNVWEFSYRDTARHLAPLGMGKKAGAKRMNEALLDCARHYKPDLLLLGHSELVLPNTLVALREALPSCKMAQWWVDWFTDYSISHLRAKMPLLDVFYATTAPSYCKPLLDGGWMPSLYYLPNIVDSSVETGCAFAAEQHRFDVLFAGTDSPERAALLARLDTLADVHCGLFGFGGRQKLAGAAFIDALATSKMGLNLSRDTRIPLYSSDRLVQLTGNGCLTLTPRTPQMTTLFGEDEVVYYDNDEHLLELIRRHNVGNAWRGIAEAGWRRAHGSYNEQRVTRFMIDAVCGNEFAEQYEWLRYGDDHISSVQTC